MGTKPVASPEVGTERDSALARAVPETAAQNEGVYEAMYGRPRAGGASLTLPPLAAMPSPLALQLMLKLGLKLKLSMKYVWALVRVVKCRVNVGFSCVSVTDLRQLTMLGK